MNACPICGKEIPGTASTCEPCAETLRRDLDLLDAQRIRDAMRGLGFSTDSITAYIQRLEGEI